MTSRTVLLAFLFAAGPAAAGLEEVRVLPTESCGDFLFVRMAVSGDPERMLSMLLDTGASHTVIDVDSAERVAGKRLETGRHVRFAKLTAGDLRFSGVRAEVMQLDTLQLALGKPMDGILGFPVFRELLLTLDYPAGEVRVSRGSLPRPDGERILETVVEKRRPLIELDIGGRPRALLIDSGASSGFVLGDAEGLRLTADPVAYDSTLRIDRVMLKSGARLAVDVRLGGATFARPTVQIARSTELFGTAVLRHFVLTFDQKRRRVRFDGAATAPILSPPLRDFGWSVRPVPEGYELLRVFEGLGASRAGLKPGDLVVEIEGTPVYQRERCDRGPETRERVAVTVEREGRRLELTVPIDTVVP